MGSAEEVAAYWLSGWLEQPQTKRKEFCSPPVSEEAEIADAHKTARQQVEEKAAKELFDRQGHEPLLVAVSGVAPAKGYVALGESNQSVRGLDHQWRSSENEAMASRFNDAAWRVGRALVRIYGSAPEVAER